MRALHYHAVMMWALVQSHKAVHDKAPTDRTYKEHASAWRLQAVTAAWTFSILGKQGTTVMESNDGDHQQALRAHEVALRESIDEAFHRILGKDLTVLVFLFNAIRFDHGHYDLTSLSSYYDDIV